MQVLSQPLSFERLMPTTRLKVMLWRFGWLPAISMAITVGSAQTTLDLSKDPRLQQTFDFHVKRVLLPEFLSSVHKLTNQKFLMDGELESLMVCVFAHKKPLWLVMQDVAAVFGCRWKDLGSEWRLSLLPGSNSALDDYRKAEDRLLCNEERLRGQALARLAVKQAWVGAPNIALSADKEPAVEETPEAWATRVAADPAYYAAGIMLARTSILGAAGGKLDCLSDLTTNLTPVAYRFIAPPSQLIADTNQCGPVDAGFEKLSGYQIAVRSLNWAGSFQAVGITDVARLPSRPAKLLRHPKPTPELARTPAGKQLLDWETSLPQSDEPALDAKVGDIIPAASHFYGGSIGIEECLEALADATDIPVVCDGFRVPIAGDVHVGAGSTVRQWLATLQQSQECFVRVGNGSVMVRHGGFWDLRDWEPPELLFARMESITKHGLDDYADFAYGVLDAPHGPQPFCAPFFESQQVPLASFDVRPIMDSLLTLAAFGQMNERLRFAILTGIPVDWYRSLIDVKSWAVASTQGTYKGKPYFVWRTSFQNEYNGEDRFVNAAACYGPFNGGVCVGFERKLFESYVNPSAYRHLWGDCPDDDQAFVYQFDKIGEYHAHYLSIPDLSFDRLQSTHAARRLTGKFTFFMSIDSLNGVRCEVAIPE